MAGFQIGAVDRRRRTPVSICEANCSRTVGFVQATARVNASGGRPVLGSCGVLQPEFTGDDLDVGIASAMAATQESCNLTSVAGRREGRHLALIGEDDADDQRMVLQVAADGRKFGDRGNTIGMQLRCIAYAREHREFGLPMLPEATNTSFRASIVRIVPFMTRDTPVHRVPLNVSFGIVRSTAE